MYRTLADVLFWSQLTTATLYDPMLPLLLRAEREPRLREPVAQSILGYVAEMRNRQLDAETFKIEAAELLWKHIEAQTLGDTYRQMVQSREPMPEVLLFSAFGLPGAVELV
jgi:hypothetical protein